jgi:hypothetical protein
MGLSRLSPRFALGLWVVSPGGLSDVRIMATSLAPMQPIGHEESVKNYDSQSQQGICP